MTTPTSPARRDRRILPVLTVGAALASLALGVGLPMLSDGNGVLLIVLGTVGLVFLFLVFRVPVQWLPVIALVTFCVVPLRIVPSTGAFNAVPPLAVLLIVWVVRRVLLRQNPALSYEPPLYRQNYLLRATVYVSAAVLALWLLFSLARSTAPNTSVGWTVSFAVSVLLVLLVGDARVEASLLRSAFLWLGGIFSLYAMLELVLRSSPLYSAIYRAVGADTTAPWSVYRSEASFGHPLNAGAFFAIPAALGLGSWLAGGPRRYLVLGLLSAVGVVTTVSRGSILAVGISFVFAVLAAAFTTTTDRKWQRLTVIAVVGVVAIVALQNFQPLSAREGSVESGLSADARTVGTGVALQAAQDSGWLGTGPGTSGISGRLLNDVIIENSILQLLISIGLPGLLFFLVFIGLVTLVALRNRDIGAAAAVVAYMVSIAGYNSIDALRSLHILIGLLVILAMNGEVLAKRQPEPMFAAEHRRPDGRKPTRAQLSRGRLVHGERAPRRLANAGGTR